MSIWGCDCFLTFWYFLCWLFEWFQTRTDISLHDACLFLVMLLQMGYWLFMTTLPLVLMSLIPGRLCDGPSSPCRPQATSCWAPPATSSSCWRKRRSEQRRACRCHRKAGSGSCRTCCWERFLTYDTLTVLRLISYPLLDVGHRWNMWSVSSASFHCSLARCHKFSSISLFFVFSSFFCCYTCLPVCIKQCHNLFLWNHFYSLLCNFFLWWYNK